MSKPIKILMVVMDFYQAGAERFAYEIDCTLSKAKFAVSLLSVRNLRSDKNFDDFYFEKHKAIGSKIYFADNFLKDDSKVNTAIKKIFLNKYVRRILPRKMESEISLYLNKEIEKKNYLGKFIKSFDVINWIGEYTPTFLMKHLDQAIFKKSLIHIMSFRFQNALYYQSYPKEFHYNFVSGFETQEELSYELRDIKHYRHFFFPICLEIRGRENKWKFNTTARKKIGIFTRLDAMKPLDIFMAAFHLLICRLDNVELHVFGAGDPVASGMKRLADNFHIADKVFFRGHQKDILATVSEEKLDLAWFQGYENRPGGYAGFDICTTGAPQLFWDFALNIEAPVYQNGDYFLYKDLKSFVDKSIGILTDETEAKLVSEKQFNSVISKKDIRKYLPVLENVFIEIAEQEST